MPLLPPVHKKCCGPGYASPMQARETGPREKIMFVTCPHVDDTKPDMICTVDLDPESETCCQVLCKLEMPNVGDEIHHNGWNSCSSCHNNSTAKRTHLICPCLNSDRIYFINVTDPKNLTIDKTIEPEQLHKLGVSFPHTSHCLADDNIMISTIGDEKGNDRGNFLLVDGESFKPTGLWADTNNELQFNHDFWYQPRKNVMISTEFGKPNSLKEGFKPEHVAAGHYGQSIHIFDWKEKKLTQSIKLPATSGTIPFEIRFVHNPDRADCFMGAALGSSIFHIHPESEVFSCRLQDSSKYQADCVESIPSCAVSNWMLPEMPALVSDVLISLDDRFLYCTCYLHGEVRQYDISEPSKPKLCGKVALGGLLHKGSEVEVKDSNFEQHDPTVIKGVKIEGGPHMMQLSLDGSRLYVTMSLYRNWDQQFYPALMRAGGTMVLIDVDQNGGLSLNQDFLIDFGALPGGPYRAHEMRYPGGDCTSDIWI